MVGELLIRFAIGGAVVSAFSLLSDLFKPKTFAGIFSAAPSVALATLALAFAKDGRGYAAKEGEAMLLGAVALGVYSLSEVRVVIIPRVPPWAGAAALWVVWAGIAFALKAELLTP